jgi:hypothetical protein
VAAATDPRLAAAHNSSTTSSRVPGWVARPSPTAAAYLGPLLGQHPGPQKRLPPRFEPLSGLPHVPQTRSGPRLVIRASDPNCDPYCVYDSRARPPLGLLLPEGPFPSSTHPPTPATDSRLPMSLEVVMELAERPQVAPFIRAATCPVHSVVGHDRGRIAPWPFAGWMGCLDLLGDRIPGRASRSSLVPFRSGPGPLGMAGAVGTGPWSDLATRQAGLDPLHGDPGHPGHTWAWAYWASSVSGGDASPEGGPVARPNPGRPHRPDPQPAPPLPSHHSRCPGSPGRWPWTRGPGRDTGTSIEVPVVPVPARGGRCPGCPGLSRCPGRSRPPPPRRRASADAHRVHLAIEIPVQDAADRVVLQPTSAGSIVSHAVTDLPDGERLP